MGVESGSIPDLAVPPHQGEIVSKLDWFVARHRLSGREREILGLLLQGVHPKGVGELLGCQYSSVRTHLSRMYKKLDCCGTRELVLRFFSAAEAARAADHSLASATGAGRSSPSRAT